MTDQIPPPPPSDAPVDPHFTHPASPFIRTEAPDPVAFGSPAPGQGVASTWVVYRSRIELGLAIVAYMMVLVGSVTVVQANPQADWRYYFAALPVLPAALVVRLFMRALRRLDDLQKRIQMEAFGFSLGVTALVTFGYGFLEAAGLPHLSWTLVLPLMALLWGVGTAVFSWRRR